MATTGKVLSQMGSVDSAQMISTRNQVIRNRQERNEMEKAATFSSTISRISLLIMVTVAIMTIANPTPIKAIWGKISPYILL